MGMGLFGPPDVERLKAKGDVKGLIKALEYEKDWHVRRDAAEAFGQIGDPRAIGPLIAAFKDGYLNEVAAEALVKIGARAVEPLIAALSDEGVREPDVRAPGHAGPVTVEVMTTILNNADNEWRDTLVRTAAAKALGQIGDPRAVGPLIAALKDRNRDDHVHEFAVRALGQIGDPRAVEPLHAALNDQHQEESVRNAAAEALGRIGTGMSEPRSQTNVSVSATHLEYTLEGHTSPVHAVAVTPKGAQIVSGSDDSTVCVWNLASGRLERTLKGHTKSVSAVAATPDGRRIVSGGWDNTVRVWDLASGLSERTLEGHTQPVRAVAVTPDGTRIVSGGNDRTVRVWDLASGRLAGTLEAHTKWVNSVAVTPNGTRIVSGSLDNTVRVWDLISGRLERTLEGHTGSVSAVAVTSDGRRIVSGGGLDDNTVRVWDLISGRLERTLTGHTGSVYAVAVTPDGTRIVSGGNDGTVRVWDLASGHLERTLEGHTEPVWGVEVTPDGDRIVSGSGDGTVRLRYLMPLPNAASVASPPTSGVADSPQVGMQQDMGEAQRLLDTVLGVPKEREQALIAISQLPNRDELIPIVMDLLDKGESAYYVVKVLDSIGTPAALGSLLDVFRAAEPSQFIDDGITVRRAVEKAKGWANAVVAIGNDGSAAVALVKLDPSLEELKAKCSPEELERILFLDIDDGQDANPRVYRALVESGTPRAVGFLIHTLDSSIQNGRFEVNELARQSLLSLKGTALPRISMTIEKSFACSGSPDSRFPAENSYNKLHAQLEWLETAISKSD
jgi:WD40 repeat protein